MTILSDWELRKQNARAYLMLLYRELREVLDSNLILKEKDHLFLKTHHDIQPRSWLVRPDLYDIESDDFKGPNRGRPGAHHGEARLRAYLDELGVMLDYTKHKAELLAAVQDVSAVMDLDLPIGEVCGQERCSQRKDKLQEHVPRLAAAFGALRLKPLMEVGSPNGGYFWDTYSHREYIKALQACALRA